MQALETMTSAQLVETFNQAAAQLPDTNTVRKFSDKKTAIRRTKKALALLEETKPVVKAEKPKKPRKKRMPCFQLPYNGDEFFRPVRSETSLRGRVVELLKEGGTWEEIVATVNTFDSETNNTTGNVERRAYEVVRIIHYYLGWGIDHNQETGLIKLHRREVG